MNNKIKYILIISIIVQFIYITGKKIEFHPNYLLNAFKNEFKGNLNLPKETSEIKNIIKNENIKVYNLSNNFLKNKFLYQRTIEYSYPSKFSKKHNIFFELINENNNHCEVLKKNNYTQISKCILK